MRKLIPWASITAVLLLLILLLAGCSGGGHTGSQSAQPISFSVSDNPLGATMVMTDEATARIDVQLRGADSYRIYRSRDKAQRGDVAQNTTTFPIEMSELQPDVPEYFTIVPVVHGAEQSGVQLTVVPYRVLPVNWSVTFIDDNDTIWGVPPASTVLYKSLDQGMSQLPVFDFATVTPSRSAYITSVFVDSHGTIFVSLNNSKIYRSTDGGTQFTESLTLLGSTQSRVQNTWGITEDNAGRLYLGEYANAQADSQSDSSDGDNWVSVANFYWSQDDGATWQHTDYFIRQKTTKHIHTVKYDPYNHKLYLTDGDGGTSKRLFVNNTMKKFDQSLDANGDGWQLLLPANQGGFTGVTFSPKWRLFSTDFMPAGKMNFFVRTCDDVNFEQRCLPAPFNSMSFDMRRVETPRGDEIWATIYDEWHLDTVASGLFYSTNDGATWKRYAESAAPEAAQKMNWSFMSNSRCNCVKNYLIIFGAQKTIRIRRDL